LQSIIYHVIIDAWKWGDLRFIRAGGLPFVIISEVGHNVRARRRLRIRLGGYGSGTGNISVSKTKCYPIFGIEYVNFGDTLLDCALFFAILNLPAAEKRPSSRR